MGHMDGNRYVSDRLHYFEMNHYSIEAGDGPFPVIGGVVRVAKNLWFGCRPASVDNFDFVIDCSTEGVDTTHRGARRQADIVHLPLVDGIDHPTRTEFRRIRAAYALACGMVDSGMNVAIICANGRESSPLIAAMVLARHMSAEDAAQLVRDASPEAVLTNPKAVLRNPFFLKLLAGDPPWANYDEPVFGKSWSGREKPLCTVCRNEFMMGQVAERVGSEMKHAECKDAV